MSTERKPRILIVGAGPTGLTAAAELARQGLAPRIIEARPTPSSLSRAVGILPGSIRLLQASGVSAAILAEAIAFEGAMFHDGARKLVSFPFGFAPEARIWGLAQDRTETLLAEALQRYGGQVEYSTRFETLHQQGDGVIATLNGRAEAFDYVLGADGSRSQVRAALGLDFPGYDLPGTWSIADVDSNEWQNPHWFQGFILDHGHVAVVVPLAEARFRVVSSLPDALASLPVPLPVSKLHRAGQFTIAIRQVTQYRQGRVYLAGDAAHCHSPVGGRGMNLGIADACDFAASLCAGTLAGYSERRHSAGAKTIATTERVRKLIQAQNPATRATVRGAMRLANTATPLARFAMRRLFEG